MQGQCLDKLRLLQAGSKCDLILVFIHLLLEQHVCIKFCVKLGKSITETLEKLPDAFGEHSLSQTAVFEWHSHFKASRVSAEDDKRSGRPSTSKMTENVEKIQELIHGDHC
jgi:hypothetical protein